MKGLNKVQLIGHLGADPQITTFTNGGMKASFSLATTDGYKDEQGQWKDITDWHFCYANGKLAEVMEKHFKKGLRVYIEGKLKTRKWEDQVKGTQYVTEVRITDFMFLSSKNENQESASTPQNNLNPTPTPTQTEVEDDDLPF